MVSFELGKEIKMVIWSCHERGTKKTFWVPMRNRTFDQRIPRSDALPLSHRDTTVSEVNYEVHMTRVLNTARISNVDGVMFVEKKIREMVSFELGKEIKKDVFFVLSQAWDKRKNSESPWGIKLQTFGFRAPMLYHWAIETPRWARCITKFIWHASCILLGSAMSIALCL